MTQNKCICFCLQLAKLKHLSHEEFERLNWLPMNSVVFKYFNEQCPNYLNKVFDVATGSNFQLSSSFQKLNAHFERLITVKMLCLILAQPFGTKPLTHSNTVTILIPSNKISKNIT